MGNLVRALRFDPEVMKAAASDGPLWATDVAERLVQEGVPFRRAHEATGALVRELENGEQPESIVIERVDVTDIVHRDVSASVDARTGERGPSKSGVLEQVRKLRELAAG
jgi:argininosuccinate lyase